MIEVDKFALKQAIEDIDAIANHLIKLYPCLDITNCDDKAEFKDDIKELKYISYMLVRELLRIIDNEEEAD